MLPHLQVKISFFQFIITDKMSRAEFIGLDAINENLRDFRFDAIGVFQGKFEKFKRSSIDGENEEDLIESFNVWANRMIASNPNNAQVYGIQLYDMPEGGRKLQGTSSFTFKLTDKLSLPVSENKVSGESISKIEHNRILELERDKIRLEFENDRLERELMTKTEELEGDEEEESDNMIGAVQHAVINKLPQLIDIMIMQFLKPTQAQQPVPSIGSNVDEIISEFRKINPDIESDLAKLLQIAQTKPDLFKILINQLRAM